MKLSIIIPAHNEQATIQVLIAKVLAVPLGGWDKEIIAVNDGSSDATGDILNKLKLTHPELLIISHPKNLGKGAAIKTALKEAGGDYIIIQDADGEYDPSDIPALLGALEENYRIIVGNCGIKHYPERGFHYVIGAKLLTWAVNLLFFARLEDLYTGYKLIPANIIKSLNIQSAGFEFEAEVACKILKQGLKIKEVSINYLPRSKQQGKHIRFKDAIVGFWTILKYRIK